MLRLTPVVKNLIIINAVIFLGQMLVPNRDFAGCFGPQYYGKNEDIIAGYLAMWDPATSCFKPYQLFTYMFVHGDIMHVFFNMLGLAFIAPILESYWGQKRFTMFYLITGIGAGVFYLIMHQIIGGGTTFGSMLGASGAIYGVLMGFGMIFPNMEVMLLIPPIPIKAKYLVFLLGGLTFLMDRSGNVAHFAHLGGAVFAFILINIWKRQGGGSY